MSTQVLFIEAALGATTVIRYLLIVSGGSSGTCSSVVVVQCSGTCSSVVVVQCSSGSVLV